LHRQVCGIAVVQFVVSVVEEHKIGVLQNQVGCHTADPRFLVQVGEMPELVSFLAARAASWQQNKVLDNPAVSVEFTRSAPTNTAFSGNSLALRTVIHVRMAGVKSGALQPDRHGAQFALLCNAGHGK